MFANSQAKLILRNHNGCASQFKAQGDFADLGRHERIGNQDLRRLIPAHDIDLLAAKFINNVLYSAAPHSNASPDRIDLLVV